MCFYCCPTKLFFISLLIKLTLNPAVQMERAYIIPIVLVILGIGLFIAFREYSRRDEGYPLGPLRRYNESPYRITKHNQEPISRPIKPRQQDDTTIHWGTHGNHKWFGPSNANQLQVAYSGVTH